MSIDSSPTFNACPHCREEIELAEFTIGHMPMPMQGPLPDGTAVEIDPRSREYEQITYRPCGHGSPRKLIKDAYEARAENSGSKEAYVLTADLEGQTY